MSKATPITIMAYRNVLNAAVMEENAARRAVEDKYNEIQVMTVILARLWAENSQLVNKRDDLVLAREKAQREYEDIQK